jgi:hypothetical protein
MPGNSRSEIGLAPAKPSEFAAAAKPDFCPAIITYA